MNQTKPGIVHHISSKWLDRLTSLGFNGEFNFWTKLKKIHITEGQVFVFKESNLVIGYGEVVRIEKLKIKEAWRRYGIRNGVESVKQFLDEILNSHIPIDNPSEETELLCIILTNIIRCNPIKFSEVGLLHIWNLKFLTENELESIEAKIFDQLSRDDPHDEVSAGKLGRAVVKTRLFQRQFRKRVLEIHPKRCLVCGCDMEDILEAAHIVEVSKDLSEAANPKNGLCLCRNHHRLYDKKILNITEGGILKVLNNKTKDSEYLSELVGRLDNIRIELPFEETREFILKRNGGKGKSI